MAPHRDRIELLEELLTKHPRLCARSVGRISMLIVRNGLWIKTWTGMRTLFRANCVGPIATSQNVVNLYPTSRRRGRRRRRLPNACLRNLGRLPDMGNAAVQRSRFRKK